MADVANGKDAIALQVEGAQLHQRVEVFDLGDRVVLEKKRV
jgi:hypothetical protein